MNGLGKLFRKVTSEAITRKAIEMARAGDAVNLRLCLDRIAPPRRDRPNPFALPALTEAADAAKAMAALVGAVAAGELTPGEANELSKLICEFSRIHEATELAAPVAALETSTNGGGNAECRKGS